MTTSTSVSGPTLPLTLANDTHERAAATTCSSSSSEEDYHDLMDLYTRHAPGTFPQSDAANDLENAVLVAEISACKRSRKRKPPVPAVDFLRAAKMAQAAGRVPGQSLNVPGRKRELPKKTAIAEKPYLANSIHNRAAVTKKQNRVKKVSAETIYSATINTANADSCRSIPIQTGSDAKFEKAIHAVDTMALVGRLCRVDGIMPDLALHVVYEYLRFLILLIRCQDWNVTMLWPSPMVDLAWRQHVLDTVRYLSDCQTICGRFIHYNPDAELSGQELCSMKYSRTLALYRRIFGEPPTTIWPVEQQMISAQSILHHQNNQITSANADSIQLICRIPSGVTIAIEVNLDDNVSQIFERLKKWENLAPESHILVYNGDILDTSISLKSVDLREGMTIDVISTVNDR